MRLAARTTRLRVLGSYPVAGAHSSSGLVQGQAFEPAMDRRHGRPQENEGTEAAPTVPADPQIDSECFAHGPCLDVSAEGL